jgi:hypothetical protein
MLEFSPLFKDFMILLNAKGVKYLVVGGHAIQYHGYTRPTRDLDIWISHDPQNAQKVLETLQSFGVYDPELTFEPFQQERRLIRMEFSPTTVEILDPIIGQTPELLQRFQIGSSQQIEILTIQSGLDFDTCYAERIEAMIEGIPVNIVSLACLRAIKGATDRPNDVKDLLNLDLRKPDRR